MQVTIAEDLVRQHCSSTRVLLNINEQTQISPHIFWLDFHFQFVVCCLPNSFCHTLPLCLSAICCSFCSFCCCCCHRYSYTGNMSWSEGRASVERPGICKDELAATHSIPAVVLSINTNSNFPQHNTRLSNTTSSYQTKVTRRSEQLPTVVVVACLTALSVLSQGGVRLLGLSWARYTAYVGSPA